MTKVQQRFLVLLLLVGGISGAIIYYTVDIHTFKNLTAFQPWSIMLALLFLTIGMYFDGTRLTRLVTIAGERITFLQAMQVIFGNYFLAMLTPGAAGGAVAQVMFLRRAGVPLGKATVLVLVRTLMSILFLLMAMPVVFYYDAGLVPWLSPDLLAAIAGVLVFASIGGLAFFRTRMSLYLTLRVTRRMKHGRRRKLFGLYHDIRSAVGLLSQSPAKVICVFFESGASLLSLYAVVPALFLGLGAAVDWAMIMGRMIFLNLLLYFAPTPGGSGIAEGGFVILFGELLPAGTVGVLAVAWRILAEYVPFSLGFYFTIQVFGRDFLAKELK